VTDDVLPAEAGIGRVALRVSDLEETARFYESVIGLQRLGSDPRLEGTGDRATDRVVLGTGGGDGSASDDGDGSGDGSADDEGSAGDPLLVLIGDPDAGQRGRREAGLYHVAIRVPTRAALGATIERIRSRARLDGASDHLVSEAVYLRDPEGNGLEVYCDRPRSEWSMTADRVEIDTLPLDLDALVEASDGADVVPPDTDVGHVHLEVTDLAAARACYVDALGLRVRFATDSALFVAAGEYHHHVGLNTWHGRSAPAGDGLGLAWFEVVVPDEDALDAAAARLAAAGVETERTDGAEGTTVAVRDPDGVELRFWAD